MKKRGLMFLLAVCVLISMFCLSVGEEKAWAATQEEIYENGFTYLEFDEMLVLKRYSGEGGDVVIPEEVNGKKVKKIGSEAFSGCSTLSSVTIPKSVTCIGDNMK